MARRPDHWRNINWNGYGRKQSWPTRINPAYAWNNWGKSHKAYEYRRCLDRESNQKPPAFKRQRRKTFRLSREKSTGEMKQLHKNELHYVAVAPHVVRLWQCFPTFSTSRYPWPRSSYLTAPLEENTYFFKLIYFLIISYVRDKVVYCCWVSIF
jgi:hypothetical protein